MIAALVHSWFFWPMAVVYWVLVIWLSLKVFLPWWMHAVGNHPRRRRWVWTFLMIGMTGLTIARFSWWSLCACVIYAGFAMIDWLALGKGAE